MDRVNDLVEYRIEAVLQEMSGSTLCMLPEDEPVTSEEFVRTTRVSMSYNGFSLSIFQCVTYTVLHHIKIKLHLNNGPLKKILVGCCF